MVRGIQGRCTSEKGSLRTKLESEVGHRLETRAPIKQSQRKKVSLREQRKLLEGASKQQANTEAPFK